MDNFNGKCLSSCWQILPLNSSYKSEHGLRCFFFLNLFWNSIRDSCKITGCFSVCSVLSNWSFFFFIGAAWYVSYFLQQWWSEERDYEFSDLAVFLFVFWLIVWALTDSILHTNTSEILPDAIRLTDCHKISLTHSQIFTHLTGGYPLKTAWSVI